MPIDVDTYKDGYRDGIHNFEKVVEVMLPCLIDSLDLVDDIDWLYEVFVRRCTRLSLYYDDPDYDINLEMEAQLFTAEVS